MSDLVPVKRALISVSDKTGLAEFAKALVHEFGVTLLSTGGTAKFLRDSGLTVSDVSDVTGFPEMMDGRVKTLHPKIHGGLLAIRDNAEHVAAANAHGIEFIDLVCINLYPFAQTIAKPNVTLEDAIENIDIGGPSMVRSAAKNNAFVTVVTSPDQYEKVLGDLRQHKGSTCGRHRLKLAQKAFDHTATYDRTIADYLVTKVPAKGEGKSQTGGGPARFLTGPAAGRIALATDDVPEKLADSSKSERRLIDRLRNAQGNLSQFLYELLLAQAVGAHGTEAACFMIEPGRQENEALLRLTHHIRPDQSTPEVRQQAIEAFQEIVKPCVQQNKDGAIEVGSSAVDDSLQYCLVTLLHHAEQLVAVTAVIMRCPGRDWANDRLGRMQAMAGYFELWQPSESSEVPDARSGLPSTLAFSLTKKQELRYGENPHQKGALYTAGTQQPAEASVAYARQHHGKELSYINLLDADAAMSAVKEFTTPAACVVKHATPCGLATAADLPTAFANAYAGDPVAAFGGIVALNRPVDLPTAQAITDGQKFLEVILAPAFAPDALDLLKSRWKNVRLLEVPGNWQLAPGNSELMMHKIAGGFLVQQRDTAGVVEPEWKIASDRQPTPQELADLRVAWLACKHVKSNAIAIAKGGMMLGSGAGQQDRVNACRIAIAKAGPDRAKGSVAASDAFFPFPDGPELLLNAGVTAIVQPGGSVRDAETLALVNARGAAMVLTGQRHFKH